MHGPPPPHVMSRLPTTVFLEREETMMDMRTHLDAAYMLSGTCRIAETPRALFVELIRSKDGAHASSWPPQGQAHRLFAADDKAFNNENPTATGANAAGSRSGALVSPSETSDPLPQAARRILNGT